MPHPANTEIANTIALMSAIRGDVNENGVLQTWPFKNPHRAAQHNSADESQKDRSNFAGGQYSFDIPSIRHSLAREMNMLGVEGSAVDFDVDSGNIHGPFHEPADSEEWKDWVLTASTNARMQNNLYRCMQNANGALGYLYDSESTNLADALSTPNLYLLANNIAWCYHNCVSFLAMTDLLTGYYQSPENITPANPVNPTYDAPVAAKYLGFLGPGLWYIPQYQPALSNTFPSFSSILSFTTLYDSANVTSNASSSVYASIGLPAVSFISNNAPCVANNDNPGGFLTNSNAPSINSLAMWLYTANGTDAFSGASEFGGPTDYSRPPSLNPSGSHPAEDMTPQEVYLSLLNTINNYTLGIKGYMTGDIVPYINMMPRGLSLFDADRDKYYEYGVTPTINSPERTPPAGVDVIAPYNNWTTNINQNYLDLPYPIKTSEELTINTDGEAYIGNECLQLRTVDGGFSYFILGANNRFAGYEYTVSGGYNKGGISLLPGKKWVVSFYAKASHEGITGTPVIYLSNGYYTDSYWDNKRRPSMEWKDYGEISTSWTRHSLVADFRGANNFANYSNTVDVANRPKGEHAYVATWSGGGMDFNVNTAVGMSVSMWFQGMEMDDDPKKSVFIDAIQVEEISGDNVTPSEFEAPAEDPPSLPWGITPANTFLFGAQSWLNDWNNALSVEGILTMSSRLNRERGLSVQKSVPMPTIDTDIYIQNAVQSANDVAEVQPSEIYDTYLSVSGAVTSELDALSANVTETESSITSAIGETTIPWEYPEGFTIDVSVNNAIANTAT